MGLVDDAITDRFSASRFYFDEQHRQQLRAKYFIAISATHLFSLPSLASRWTTWPDPNMQGGNKVSLFNRLVLVPFAECSGRIPIELEEKLEAVRDETPPKFIKWMFAKIRGEAWPARDEG